MSVWMRRFSYCMPILFAGLIALLFFQEFRGSERVSWEQSSITLNAYTLAPNAHRDGQVRNLVLETDGFVVDLSRGRGVIGRSESGRAEVLNPVDFRERDGGFIIELDGGYAVEVLREPGDRPAIQLAIAKPSNREPLRSYEFSLRAADGARFRRTENSPVLEVQADDRVYNLILPDTAVYDAVNRRVIFSSEPDTQTIRYVYEPEPEVGTLATWARSGDLSLTGAEHEDLLDAFAADVVEGWNERFSQAAGTWSSPDGGSRFDERIAAALMSRAWDSTVYDLRAAELRNAAEMHMSARTFRTAPYFGDLNRFAPEMRDAVQEQERELRSLVREDPIALLHFADPVLRMNVSDILTRIGDDDLSSAAYEALGSLAGADLTLEDAVRVVEVRYRHAGVSERFETVLSGLLDASVERIVSAVRRTSSGFYLEATPDTVDFELSVRAGLALASAGGEERLQQLGRHMVRDALNLVDEQQTLPETASIRDGSVEVLSGTLVPESWYHYLDPEPQAVRMTPLSAPFGRGAFLLSAVRLTSLESTSNEVVVEIENIPNRTHYLIFHEVPTFSGMELFRLDWRNDPNFENFSRGRNFDASAGTLNIKYTDTQSTGRIVLTL